MRYLTILLLLGAGALLACSDSSDGYPGVRMIDPAAQPDSAEPNLAVGANGKLYLSWIEPADGGHALRFSVWEGAGWSGARTIATGSDWFVNWADFPSMAAMSDGTLAAHWLAKSGDSTYAYDVRLALSPDGGESWSDPLTPHDDGTPTEHGFVSIVPADDGFDVIWLDGRETALDGHGHGAAGSGVMTLRSARIDRDMAVHTENLIDGRICDCCQTDATRTADGTVILVYRGRTELEVRDILATRLEEEAWTTPAVVHDDAWVMPACPVNGPAVASSGNTVATAWFTGQGGKGQVYVGFSDDGGKSFGEPVRVDETKPQGRVDIVLVDEMTAIVSWLGQGEIRLRWIGPAGPLGPPRVVARTSESRASGFPRMVLFEDELFLAWTEPGDVSRVHAARIPQEAG